MARLSFRSVKESRVRLFETPWTVACQASLSMGFLRQEYWRGLLFPSPGDLPDPGIHGSPTLQTGSLWSFGTLANRDIHRYEETEAEIKLLTVGN